MAVFDAYSQYYDLLYQDKNYNQEAEYVSGLIRKYAPDSREVLDLGCGTGVHARYLAEMGYSVCGVDMSERMLECAKEKQASLSKESSQRLSYHCGDIRDVRLSKKYDVVTALFHVMSYQTTNADMRATFSTIKDHLKPGGLFIFDCWYGPAVLADNPVVRVKRLENDVVNVTRIAEPCMHPNRNMVDVNYSVFVKDKKTGGVDEIQEKHQMRYLFRPEIEMFCEEIGAKLIGSFEWMEERDVGCQSWSACFVGQI